LLQTGRDITCAVTHTTGSSAVRRAFQVLNTEGKRSCFCSHQERRSFVTVSWIPVQAGATCKVYCPGLPNPLNRPFSTLNITALEGVTSCSMVDRCQHFGGTCCLHLQSISKKKVVIFSKMMTPMHHTTRRHIPESSNLHSHRRRNSDLKAFNLFNNAL
jgi:hypothetical protein